MNKLINSVNIIFVPLIVAVSIFATGCRELNEPASENVPSQPHSTVWFRQTVIDLGAHIQMLNSGSGFASSRGRGQEVPGRVYRFSAGHWNPILTYPYSDSPLISAVDSTSVAVIHHLVHSGNCRPKK